MDEKASGTGYRRTRRSAAEGKRADIAASSIASHYGGFSIEQAAHHLSKFYGANPPDARDAIFFRTTRALVVIARRWRKLANDRVKAVGQNMARWESLYIMACADQALSQSELARVVGVEGPTMVHMLNSLERDGLVERQQSTLDRRVTHNRITPKGEQVTRDIMKITNELRAELLRDIDPAKLAIALEVLEEIHTKLDDLC